MSGDPDDIYDDDGTDPLGDLDEKAPRKGKTRKARAKEWIGCPYPWWLIAENDKQAAAAGCA